MCVSRKNIDIAILNRFVEGVNILAIAAGFSEENIVK